MMVLNDFCVKGCNRLRDYLVEAMSMADLMAEGGETWGFGFNATTTALIASI